jgi:hypothetical protein
MTGRKSDIFHNDRIGFDSEALAPVCPAEGAFITGAPYGYLQQNAVGFTGGPYDISFIVHMFYIHYDIQTD